MTLAENEETVSDNKKISETLNNFFSEVVTNLNLSQYDNPTVNVEDIENPVTTLSGLSKRIIIKTYMKCLKCIWEKRLRICMKFFL